MKKLIITASAFSLLAFGSVVSAEQQLSMGQMDGVSAAGFADVFADARARGVTATTDTQTDAFVRTIDELAIPGQVGRIEVVASDGRGYSYAFSSTNPFAEAEGYSQGNTIGTGISDVVETSLADADTTGELVPGSRVSAFSSNFGTAMATEVVRGRTATANNQSASFAQVGN